LTPIILRNEIRKLFVDGDEACVIYDFVTDTPAKAVPSVEYIKMRNGRILSSLLVFERLHWPEVQAVLKGRAERQAAAARAAPPPGGSARTRLRRSPASRTRSTRRAARRHCPARTRQR